VACWWKAASIYRLAYCLASAVWNLRCQTSRLEACMLNTLHQTIEINWINSGRASRVITFLWPHVLRPRLCDAVPGQAPFYNATSSTASGITFVLNTSLLDFEGAQTNCKMNGGHLASYTSWSEQAEVGICHCRCSSYSERL
jgi:hypothetical protein